MKDSKQTVVWRYEFKYFVSTAELSLLRSLLSAVMSHDRGGTDNSTYKVNSLYFDSVDRNDEMEKMAGIKSRKKLRLRYYGDFSTFKLEIKYRNDLLVKKISQIIDYGVAKILVQGGMLESYDKSMNQYMSLMNTEGRKPQVVVSYDREAYTLPYNNIRVTFDTNVSCFGRSTDIFADNVRTPVFLDNRQVLEVKYNNFLPEYIKEILSSVISERFAISKYAYALRFSKNQQWEDI